MSSTALWAILVAGTITMLMIAVLRCRRLAQLRALRDRWGLPIARERNMTAIARYFRSQVEPRHPTGLDDRTWADLDMDGLFSILDRTESRVGQQVLYARLRLPSSAAHSEAFEALVGWLGEDFRMRETIQRSLARISDAAAYDLTDLAETGAVRIEPWYAVFPALALAMAGAVVLVPFWPPALLFVIAGTLTSLGLRGVVASGLRTVTGPFRQVGPLLAAAKTIGRLDRLDAAPILGSLQADGHKLARLRRIAAWAGRNATGAAAGDIGSIVIEYLNVLFCLDANALFFGSRELGRHAAPLLRTLNTVGEVDAALSVASYRAGTTGWVRPVVRTPGAPTRISAMRHPLLPDATPNTIILGPPHGLIVTGSNMSGKSTFLRTLGATVVLAQTINTCVADEYDAPPMIVRSCIGRADDPASGRSYYLVEVEAVLTLVAAARSEASHLMIFDELFRGTNTVERIAAGEAVLATLVEGRPDGSPPPHLVVVATHDRELVELLADTYAAYHFADSVGPDGLSFDYRLRPGSASSRNAIALLSQRGAPSILLSRARARVEYFDSQQKPQPTPRQLSGRPSA